MSWVKWNIAIAIKVSVTVQQQSTKCFSRLLTGLLTNNYSKVLRMVESHFVWITSGNINDTGAVVFFRR